MTESTELNEVKKESHVFAIAASILTIMAGCGSNAVFLEKISRADPGCGQALTCLAFVFAALFSSVYRFERSKTGFGIKLKTPSVPLHQYIWIVVVFFVTSVLANRAFLYKISVPLHMIFRSGSLVANMVVGVLFFRKKHTLSQALCVFGVTIGVFMASLASAPAASAAADESAATELSTWLTGLAVLGSSLFVSSFLGHIQERYAQGYQAHWTETTFFTHFLSLPLFLFFASDIKDRLILWSQSEPMELPFIGPMPSLFVHLAGFVITNYFCVSGVHQLTRYTSSLTTTLVVTLRKFVSLVVSLLVFGNDFTLTHWMASLLVLSCSTAYSFAPAPPKQKTLQQKKQD